MVGATDTLRVGSATGLPGSLGNAVFVELANDAPRAGVLFRIDDLPDDLSLSGIAGTPRTSHMYIDFSDVGGDARVIILSLSGQDVIAAGTGPIVELRFNVIDSIAGPFEIVALEPCGVQIADTNDAPVQVDSVAGEFIIGDPTGAEAPSFHRSDGKVSLFAFPSPFNPTTRINYQLFDRSAVKLAVYDVSGRLVRTLIDEVKPAGSYHVTWNGLDDTGEKIASGVYFAVLTDSRGNVSSRKLITLK